MANDQYMHKMQARQSYRNHWHTDLMNATLADPLYCCFSVCCAPCASYLLRKRALYNDMSRYTCCGGYMPCSGRCGESHCPELCLCTETQHKVEMDKRDGKFGGPQAPMAVPPVQHMSRIDQPLPPPAGSGQPPPAYPPQQQGYAYPPPPGQGYSYQQPGHGYGYPPPPPPGQGYAYTSTPPTQGYPLPNYPPPAM